MLGLPRVDGEFALSESILVKLYEQNIRPMSYRRISIIISKLFTSKYLFISVSADAMQESYGVI